jgi:hypothetical protein
MFVRLGFSVAVHTHPDILLIDEVLAVGDAGFQRRCLEKIAEFRRSQCTILFVSHDLRSIEELCSKVIWLEHGRIREMGDPTRVVSNYAGAFEQQLARKLADQNRLDTGFPPEPGKLCIQSVSMLDAAGTPRWTFHSGEIVRVRIEYETKGKLEEPIFSILLHRSDGLYVSSTNTFDVDPLQIGPVEGRGTLTVDIDNLNLYAGEYLLSVGAYLAPDPPHWSSPAHFLDKQYRFRVESDSRHGVMVLPARWTHSVLGDES